jgi:hypothetical protein
VRDAQRAWKNKKLVLRAELPKSMNIGEEKDSLVELDTYDDRSPSPKYFTKEDTF